MESLFNNSILSDIKLVLVSLKTGEEDLIYAHKQILANSSPFFLKLFTSEYKENKEEKIIVKVPDIDIALILIEWMYNHELDIPDDTEELAEQWLIIEPFQEKIHYPGKRGRFIFVSDKPEILYERVIKYISQTYNSAIIRFELSIYKGKRGLKYEFIPELKNFREYLNQYNIKLDDIQWKYGNDIIGGVFSSEGLIPMIHVILNNNDFEPKEIQRINAFFDYEL